MSIKDKLPGLAVALVVVGGIGATVWNATGTGAATVEVAVPELSPRAALGRLAFAENCAACHGAKADGTDSGPPLVHRLYNPGHHGDDAVRAAIRNGVTRHHWSFGDMPPRPEVSGRDGEAIIAFIRELQRANGM